MKKNSQKKSIDVKKKDSHLVDQGVLIKGENYRTAPHKCLSVRAAQYTTRSPILRVYMLHAYRSDLPVRPCQKKASYDLRATRICVEVLFKYGVVALLIPRLISSNCHINQSWLPQ
jgi:hypothetical protein